MAWSGYLKYSRVLSNNTQGGTCTTGAWRTYPINTEDEDAGGYGSLSADEITLAAGTYKVRITACICIDQPYYYLRLRLYNVTDGAVSIMGSSLFGSSSCSFPIEGVIVLAASKTLRVEYNTGDTTETYGLGKASNFGNDEVYLVAEFWKDLPPSEYAALKRYTGAAWTKAPMQACADGATFEDKPLKWWNSEQWIVVDTTGA